jgi:adenosylhomocysteine nucleosidase
MPCELPPDEEARGSELKVLATFALENEFTPWRKMARFQLASVRDLDRWYDAQIGPADVRVVVTGTGEFAAQSAMKRAFDCVPDFCIASGLAGALTPSHIPGDVLVGRQVTEMKSRRSLPSDGELRRLATEMGATPVETFLVADRVIATIAEKQQLAAMGDAVEMEGAQVFSAAAQHGVRCVAIRSVSDTMDRDLPLDFDRVFDDAGRVSVARVLGQVVRKPSVVGGLIRLAENSSRAANALAVFLNAFVQMLPSNPEETAKAMEAIAL